MIVPKLLTDKKRWPSRLVYRVLRVIERGTPLVERGYVRRLRRIQRKRFTQPRERVQSNNVIVYCPNIGGHRPVYSARFIDHYRDRGCQVYFIYCGILVSQKAQKLTPFESQYLEKYRDDPNVHLVCVRDELTRDTDELAFIVEQQRKFNAAITIFVDGDALMDVFWRQTQPGSPRLIGYNYAVIILIDFIYRKMSLSELWRQPVKREQWPHMMFHQYRLKHVDLIDGALCCDENLVDRMNSPRHFYLGDVCHVQPQPRNDSKRSEFFARTREELDQFLARNPDKEVILQFGELEPRKGFDFLLRLVTEEPDLVLVRTGRTKPSIKIEWKSLLAKENLRVEDRLFEVEMFIDDPQLIDRLFGSIPYLLMPYKNHFRTSIMMAQALSYNKPVLVPDIGLMPTRVRKYEVGRVFKHLDYKSFKNEWSKLRHEARAGTYTDTIRKCYRLEFSDEAFEERLEDIVAYEPAEQSRPVEVPVMQA